MIYPQSQFLAMAGDERWSDIVDLIKAKPSIIELRDEFDNNLLVDLALYGDRAYDALALLLKLGMDPNEPANGHAVALQEAIRGVSWKGGAEHAVRLLLDNGADPNQYTSLGDTVLQFALRYKNLNIAKLLLEYGASPYKETNDLPKENSFELVRKLRWPEAEKLLSEYKNPDSQ